MAAMASLQRLYALTRELESLWRAIDAEEDECCSDTDAVVMPAVAAVEALLLVWRQRQADLERQCSDIQCKLGPVANEPHMDPSLSPVEANRLPLRRRLAALQQLADFSGLHTTRAKLLSTLGRSAAASANDIASLHSEVEHLKAEVQDRRKTMKSMAESVDAVWRELGETPRSADEVLLAALAAPISDIEVTDAAMSAVIDSEGAWERRRAEVVSDVARLHAVLRGFGSANVVEEFITAHCTLHSSDRAACKSKLEELQAVLRLESTTRDERLSYLFDVTGAGPLALSTLYSTLDAEAANANVWRERLAAEHDRMERYFESLRGILEQLEELHGLVLEGLRFAEAKKVSDVPSLHFLEEEKYRKVLLRRYPPIHDRLLADIKRWEASEGQRLFYHGAALSDQLILARENEADPARGLLSVIAPLLRLLSVQDSTRKPPVGTPVVSSTASSPPERATRRPPSAARSRAPSSGRATTTSSQCTAPP
eukprot:CAMPEP_0117593330 /NCGR_PEP_ID=MMETSP0784-20121206/72575_1 /TAXON_ID=39447 /ORGANISM="" /LENGTH=484 /DNA_ID=CAMNT_0005395245 /DNA_START=37 /DNA_END=1488 /DNA_ORIENTATION=+